MRAVLAVCMLLPFAAVMARAELEQTGRLAEKIRNATGMKGGLVVHLGCGDGRQTATLHAGESYIVHGLDTDARNVSPARRHVRDAGLYGPVSIEQLTGERLPYADNLVNLVVVSAGKHEVPGSELRRVLAPHGAAVLAPGAELSSDLPGPLSPLPALPGWQSFIKPRPLDIDEWSHFLHDAGNTAVARDRRVGPPDSLQWEAPPKFGRSHEHDSTIPAAVAAGGRIFYVLDEGPTGVTDPRLPQKWALIARNAFNGVKLWRIPLKDWGWPQWSPDRAVKKWNEIRGVFCAAPRTLARRLVASEKHVFVTLGYNDGVSVVDATDGKVLRTCKNSAGTEEIVHSGNRLLLLVRKGKVRTLLCSDPATGAVLWRRPAAAAYIESTLAAGDRHVFICDGKQVAALHLADGKPVWQEPLPADPPWHLGRNHIVSLTLAENVLLVLHHRGLHARDAATGKLLWKGPGGQGYGMAFPPEIYVIRGAAYYFQRPNPKLEPWPNAQAFDLRTGKAVREVTVPPNLIKPRGHTRCYHAKASERYLFLGSRAVELLDLEGDNHVNAFWIKPSCRYGVIPANGMLYVPPNPCQCRITHMLHGFNALLERGDITPAKDPPLIPGPAYKNELGTAENGSSLSHGERAGVRGKQQPERALTLTLSRREREPEFHKQPASAQIGNRQSPIANPSDWPAFRHDPARSGATAMRGPDRLEEAWRVTIGPRPTQPTAAGNRLFVPCREANRLDCLDARSGRLLWSFTAGGRIDSPPTLLGNRLYFGSADGYVYCLRMADGERVWTFRAAPSDRRIVCNNRLESAWPVHGSVLLTEGPEGRPVAYCTAGRSSHLDGGIRLYGLDPSTGRQLYTTTVRSPRADVTTRRTPWPKGVLSDVLVCNGDRLFMRNMAFDLSLKRIEDAREHRSTRGNEREKRSPDRLSAWGGLLDGNTWNRTFWMVGPTWPTHYANQSPRAGQMLVFDRKATYAVQYFTTRNFHSPMFFPAKSGYLLFADSNANQPYLYDGKPGSAKPIRWLPAVPTNQYYEFNTPVRSRDPRTTGYTRLDPPLWKEYVPLRIRAMTLAGDRLYVAGPPDELKKGDELAAFEGRTSGRLRVVDTGSGRTISEYELDAPPVFDGMIAACGRVYVACRDGNLVCLEEARVEGRTKRVKRLNVPALTAKESASGFEQRRQWLLRKLAGDPASFDPDTGRLNSSGDLYGNTAIAQLHVGRHAKAANAHLRWSAEWFDHPHPRGREHSGECDFVAQKLCLAWHLFQDTGKLEPATTERIRRFFLHHDFKSRHPSENHLLLFRTARCLMGQALPDDTFAAYKATGRELTRKDTAWLKTFIRFRARRGWGEFDSSCYIQPVWECLTCLYDYAGDAELRRMAGMMLNVILADMAVDSINGMLCGAQGRIYAQHALDHAMENTYPIQFLYFGNVDRTSLQRLRATKIETLVSGFRPRSIVLDIALDRTDDYVNRERKHLHNTTDVLPESPLPGSIRKLTWYTPDYVLGAVQLQDPYPAGSRAQHYAHHEQHEWDLSFPTRTKARLFTHHPGKHGNEHGYWTGDLACRCVSTFQHRTAVLALYHIPKNQAYQWIHAYVPRAAFDEVMEENGWIFVREGNACAALRMLGGHRNTTQGEWKNVEVISPGARNGAVCEVGRLSDFGGFEAFRREIAANTILFDSASMQLTYESRRAGTITMNTEDLRMVDGKPVDLDCPTYDCPYLQSAWDSGVITLIHASQRLALDFREPIQGNRGIDGHQDPAVACERDNSSVDRH